MDQFAEYYKSSKKTMSIDYADVFEMEEIDKRHLYINGAIEEREPIILYINSPGGSVTDGYGVIDAITTSKTPVYTVNQGICFSMGFLIFIAGHKRFSMPHAEFLMHDGSTSGWDSTAKMKDRMKFETMQLETMTKDYILSKTKIGDQVYDEKYRVEWYFLPKEAKELGVVDSIIGVDCDIDEII